MTPKQILLSLQASIVAVAKTGRDHGPVRLAQYGAFEVRLLPVSQASRDHSFVFWFDLFDRESQLSIDTGSTTNIDEAVALLSEFELQAQALNVDRTTERT
jgi:hypothetical protein